MKNGLFIGLLLAGLAVLASAQTNPAPVLLPEYSLPPLRLREEKKPDVSAPTATAIPKVGITNSAMWQASIGTMGTPLGIHGRSFYVERVPREPDSLFVRGLNNVFEPEVFQLGKKTVSCSLATAIKRKNPLCLLNPIFFNLSW